ncbi:MAG: PEP-CTERM sorting domain-containing protein [Thiobacillus sp.]|uniref:PEP-CTERM sorting domain-containing protein n=1 Tax=Thiobacillus sp. TaxID=924 RepID=UPI00273317E7|nr:PEP-CTERM sorting domain-containing protein [Thiobacillus sp.]MDP3584466.1 PEP-CTERM sorting domain-containing protein [Thiobacillus sp.]
MRTPTKAAVAALGLAGFLLVGAASANEVTFTFDTTQPDFSMFGTPTVSGNSLTFAPSSFRATDGAPAYPMITITVTANAGYFLSGFQLIETGGYTLPTSVDEVSLGGVFEALDIEGTTGNLVSSAITGSAFTTTGSNLAWTGGASLAIPASGWGGPDGLVTSVTLTIDNQLFAFGAGEIWKDAISVVAVATPVPEAETYAMMLVGLGLVGFMVRRRSRAIA